LKKLLLSVFALLCAFTLYAQPHVTITINDFVENAKPKDKTRALIVLDNKVDLWNMREQFISNNVPQKERAKQVILALQAKANESQPELLELLNNEFEEGRDFSINRSFWLINGLELSANKNVLNFLKSSELISLIMHPEDEKFTLMNPVEEFESPATGRNDGNTEIGLLAVGANHLWEMGYTGHNTVLYCIDTGVWEEHPAIGDRFLAKHRPLAHVWFGYDSETPVDKSGNHGTHVIGTVLGLEVETNDTIGVAFGARFIASDPVATSAATAKDLSENVIGFQWALDPDGNPETTDDIPDVINNSWGKPQTGPAVDIDPCFNSPITDVLDAIFVAGIGNIISAGNDGPGDLTLGQPANYAAHPLNMFSVGAVNGANPNFPITNFSSRGPSFCDIQYVADSIKPEVVAPGFQVRSADGRTGYGAKSGTSMAAPHVSGVFLLLKEAFPDLSGEDIMEAMYESATDLGPEGEDNTYGKGMINALAAYNYLAENHTPTPPAIRNFDPFVTIEGSDEPFRCSESNDYPTVTFHNFWDEPHTAEMGASLNFYLNGDFLFAEPLTETVEPHGTFSFEVDFSEYSDLVQPGWNEFSASYERIESEPLDYDKDNNTIFWRFVAKEVFEVPYLETFENYNDFPVSKWTIINPDFGRTWELTEANGLENSEISAFVNLASYTPRASQLDDMISPEIILPEGEKYLSFDKSYQFRNATRADTLRIFVSSDCGSTYTEIYKKGGEELGNIPGSNANFMPSLPEHWEKVYVNLDDFEGNVLINFQTENRLGNNILVDNIEVKMGETPVNINELSINHNYGIFPNPTSNSATLSWKKNTEQPETVEVFNLVGKKLAEFRVAGEDNNFNIPMLNYTEGMYLIRVCTLNDCATLRLLKQ
jgi:subtilisin family serine protease